MTVTHGFELIRKQEIPELKTDALLFRHIKTGAELLSLENDDENKVFNITFRTPPQDSTGIAHIMEHSVLCGSRKFPVKEPFVELIKGSLNTFLNAMTFPDKTCYPVASQNLTDFYNLADVYLDAVFYPGISRETFEQEGWHYELENLEAPLIYKGIVYNEMKGAYSSPDRILAEASQQSLFPKTTYGCESGGHPRHIPDLTYDQFKAFHEKYYHPSNAMICFFGNDDTNDRLQLVNQYLDNFERKEVDSMIHLQQSFDKPVQQVHRYAAGEDSPEQNKNMVTVNWLLDEATDSELTLALSILTHILLGTSASPLHKALIDSGLGEDVTGVGLESDLRQMYFSVGLKGIDSANIEKVESLILKTLTHLADNGIDQETIAASMNTVEFRLREQNTGSYPKGLILMFSSLTTWLHGHDPIAGLVFEEHLAVIKQKIKQSQNFFEGMIRQYFLQNTHRTTIVLEPDPELQKEEDAIEKKRLQEVKSSLTTEQLQEIIENNRVLNEHQQTPDSAEALATIPRLQLSDLDKKNKPIPIDILEKDGQSIFYHDYFTNGIAYFDIGFDLHVLPQNLFCYLPLFSRGLLEMGTTSEDFVKLSQRIGAQTGGIRPSILNSTGADHTSTTSWFLVRGKSTMPQANALLSILKDVLTTVHFDNRERFRQMLLDEKAGEEAGLVPGGAGVVATRLRGLFNESGWLDEQMGGVSYLFFLRELIKQVDSNWPAVLKNLEQIRRLLINRKSMIFNVTLDQENWAQIEPRVAEFMNELPSSPINVPKWSAEYGNGFEGLTIPAQVNYVGKAANLYDLGYKFHGSALVISKFLKTTLLWERVRMQGGAYGGFCSFDRHSGVFSFLSYRDPNLLKTIENYDLAGQFLGEVPLNEDELTKSIIGTIGDLDAYRLPDAKGFMSMVRHLIHDTDETRQKMRDEVLSTKIEDFRAFGEVLKEFNEKAQVVVLGSQAAIEAANQERRDWLKVTKVL